MKLLSFCALLLAFSLPAFAEPLEALAPLLRGSIGRVVLGGAEGRVLLEVAASANEEELLKVLGRPAAAPLRNELEQNMLRIQDEVRQMRELRKEPEPGMDRELSSREKFLVRILSRKLLRLQDPVGLSAMLGGAESGRIDFVDSQGAGYSGAQRVFQAERASLGERSWVPDQEPFRAGEGAPEATPVEKESLFERARNFREDMKYCTMKQAPEAARSNRVRYMMTTLAINEGITVAGYVTGMGVENIRLEELSTDMLVTAISSVVNTGALGANSTFAVQYIRVAAAQGAQDGVDAIIYFFNPAHLLTTGKPLHTPKEAAVRYAFNSSYTLLSTAWREVVMYDLIQGLVCLYPNSRWAKWGTTGLRMADLSLGTFAYFRARREVIGH